MNLPGFGGAGAFLLSLLLLGDGPPYLCAIFPRN